MYLKISELKEIKSKSLFARKENSLTVITKYRCPCGRGKIVEENTPGFNDHFVTLECKRCLKKFHGYIDIIGYEFKLYPLVED